MILDSEKCYYAIIPADVRYDESLIPSAKLLYGEITALCNTKGYCWATNDYFADFFGLSKGRISKVINNLVKRGFITSELKYQKGTQLVEKRILKISRWYGAKSKTTPSQKQLGVWLKTTRGIVKNDQEVWSKTTKRINQTLRRRFLKSQKSTTSTLKTKRFLVPIVTRICWLDF